MVTQVGIGRTALGANLIPITRPVDAVPLLSQFQVRYPVPERHLLGQHYYYNYNYLQGIMLK